MNKSGTTFFIALMLGVVCFFLGLALASPLQQVMSENMANANCSATDLNYQQKSLCTMLDMFVPLLTGVLFGIAGYLVGGNLL